MNKIDNLSVEGLRLIDDLIKTRSLKRTAAHIHISASAATRLLEKLRTIFDDQLFTRNGSQMVPTAATLSIRNDVRRSLNLLDRINQPVKSDPSNLRRTFRVGTHESIFSVHFPSFCEKVFKVAPHVKIETHGFEEVDIEKLKTGEMDFLITPLNRDFSKEIKALPLFTMTNKILVRKDHPILKKAVNGGISQEDLAKESKVQLIDKFFKYPDGADSWILRDEFVHQETVLWTPYVAPALRIVAHSNLTFRIYSRMADIICSLHDSLRSIDLGKIGNVPLALKWHENSDSDVACQWFRSLLASDFWESPPPAKSDYFVIPRFPQVPKP